MGTVQSIRFYDLFYNWSDIYKIISLLYLLERSNFSNLCTLGQNIKYYETDEILVSKIFITCKLQVTKIKLQSHTI